ncbi:MAG: hypothetical protein GY769_05670 [bacterium]|nr:hypothetical protein [bacterium]
MTVTGAFLEGLRRMSRAPGLVLAIWAANLTVALPLGVLVLHSIHTFTANSEYHQVLLEGFDTGWHAEFSTSYGAVEETFSPSHVGVGAWLTNLDRWWDGRVFLEQPMLLATGAVFVLLWLVLLGGVLEAVREGAPRPRLPTVLADGLGFFTRMLRLALVTGVGYYLVFRLVRWLFPAVHRMTIDFTTEKQVLLYNLAAAALVVLLVTLIRLVSDYAKVSMVVERRRSALLAAFTGLRFVFGNPLRVFGTACFYGIVMALWYLAYSIVAPGSGDSTPLAILLAFALSQLFLLVKQALRIAFLGSEMTFFEVLG